MSEDDPFLDEIVATGKDDTAQDRLVKLRTQLNVLREKIARLAYLNKIVEQVEKDIRELEDKVLVSAMTECRIKTLDLEAEGDYPACTAQLKDFYSAKIPEGHEPEAFDFLTASGYGDTVKNTITLAGLSAEAREAVLHIVEDANLDFEEKRAIHWKTLLRIVTELHKAGKLLDTETVKPMTLLGAYVGQTVKLKMEKKANG